MYQKWCGMNFPSLAAPSRPSGRCLPPFRLQIHPQRRQAGVAPSNNESATAAPTTTKSKNEMHSCGRGADRGRLLLHREEAVSLLEEIAVARVLVVRREPGDVRGRTGAKTEGGGVSNNTPARKKNKIKQNKIGAHTGPGGRCGWACRRGPPS